MRNKMVSILQELYSPIKVMRRRYPKAAKKRRIQNKWRNRFGDEFNPLLSELKNDMEFKGPYYPVQVICGGEPR